MANTLKIKRSSTNSIGSVGTVSFGELVMTDVTNVLKFYGVDSADGATLLMEQPSGNAAEFWCGDGTWSTPAGSGNVSNTGTPVDGQIAVWTNATTIEGDAQLTFDTTTDTLSFGATDDGTLVIGGATVVDVAAGVVTLSGIEALDATTEATIEAAIDTLSNLTSASSLSITNSQVSDFAAGVAANETSHANVVETTDTDVTGWGFVIDEDLMTSNLATKVPTQQSVKAYVDTEIAAAVASEMSYKGGYNASTNSPDLDVSPSGVALGDTYHVTTAGTFFTQAVEVGDVLIANTASATTLAHWTIVERNLDGAVIDTRAINTNANSGLAGGGDLSADRTLTLDINNLTTVTTIDGSADYIAIYDAAVGTRNILGNNFLDLGTF